MVVLSERNAEGLGVTKTLQEITFEEVWDKLKGKKVFQKEHSQNIRD